MTLFKELGDSNAADEMRMLFVRAGQWMGSVLPQTMGFSRISWDFHWIGPGLGCKNPDLPWIYHGFSLWSSNVASWKILYEWMC